MEIIFKTRVETRSALKFGDLIQGFCYCHLVLLFLIITMSATVESESLPASVLKSGNAEFSSSLYQELRKSNPTNFVSSPISLSVAMAMLTPGTQGNSSKEIANVMKFPGKNEILLEGVSSLLESLNKFEGEVLSMANKIYVQDGFDLRKEYSLALEENFNVVPEQLDFSNPANAAGEINRWVSERTKKKINHLFDKSVFDDKTRIVLVNAMHFKGKWLHPFPPEKTRKDEFHVSPSEIIQVDMMRQEAQSLKYAQLEEWNSQALILPFETKNLYMLVLLPNALSGIGALEERLSSTNILRICQNLEKQKVEVTLPKFRVESFIDMKKILQNLGLGAIFNADTAELGLIFQKEMADLKVSEIIQKAVIEINEEGAEAAAATGVHVRRTRAIQIAEEFNVNRPFIYAIFHSDNAELLEKDTSILLYGSISNPAESTNPATGKDEL